MTENTDYKIAIRSYDLIVCLILTSYTSQDIYFVRRWLVTTTVTINEQLNKYWVCKLQRIIVKSPKNHERKQNNKKYHKW